MKARRAASKNPDSGSAAGRTAASEGVSNAAMMERMGQPGMRQRILGIESNVPSSAGDLALPMTTRELLESSVLSVSVLNEYVGAEQMPSDVGARLVQGVRQEAISDAETLDEILTNYIDMGEVESLQIQDAAGATLEWLRFYCGDTEVGFIYQDSTLKAIVGDGDINLQE